MTGDEPQLGGQLSPQLGGSNYYLWVNHAGPYEGVCEVLEPGYATEAQAKLALIDWLHKHYPRKWTYNGTQFVFAHYDPGMPQFMAGMVVSKEWVVGLKEYAEANKEYHLHVVGGVVND